MSPLRPRWDYICAVLGERGMPVEQLIAQLGGDGSPHHAAQREAIEAMIDAGILEVETIDGRPYVALSPHGRAERAIAQADAERDLRDRARAQLTLPSPAAPERWDGRDAAAGGS